jgi:hypothetical protein
MLETRPAGRSYHERALELDAGNGEPDALGAAAERLFDNRRIDLRPDLTRGRLSSDFRGQILSDPCGQKSADLYGQKNAVLGGRLQTEPACNESWPVRRIKRRGRASVQSHKPSGGEARYRRFMEQVARRFASGGRFLDELPKELLANDDELDAVRERFAGVPRRASQ